MRYFSMFSGIGGFEYGIERAALSIRDRQAEDRESKTSEPSLESATKSLWSDWRFPNSISSGDPRKVSCVGYSEIDKYASRVYERHYNHKNYGDATKINAEELPDFDLLVGGFPCQAFSVAGKRAGFNDTRGTLFFDIARILKEKKPRHLVLENVKGLLTHDKGATFQTILGVLTDLGYRVEWQVLNSKDFGVPQNRERVFIVGHLGGECRRKVFPIRQDGSRTTQGKSTLSGEIQTEEPRRNSRHTDEQIFQNGENGYIHQLNQPKHSNDRVYGETGISPTLNTMQGGNRQPFISQETRIRRLTPVECERLQGFPDDWTAYGIADDPSECQDISDTQRYKMCGNAVTTNVVQAVMEALLCPQG